MAALMRPFHAINGCCILQPASESSSLPSRERIIADLINGAMRAARCSQPTYKKRLLSIMNNASLNRSIENEAAADRAILVGTLCETDWGVGLCSPIQLRDKFLPLVIRETFLSGDD